MNIIMHCPDSSSYLRTSLPPSPYRSMFYSYTQPKLWKCLNILVQFKCSLWPVWEASH